MTAVIIGLGPVIYVAISSLRGAGSDDPPSFGWRELWDVGVRRSA